MAALKIRSFIPAKTSGDITVDPVAGLTTSINRLGATVEDLGKIIAGMYKSQADAALAATRANQLALDKGRESRIENKTRSEVVKGAKLSTKLKGDGGGFLDRLLGPFKDFIEKALTFWFLDWLSDPKNKNFLEKTLPIITNWVKTGFKTAFKGIELILDGFGADSPIMGAMKIIGGVGALWLASRILQPWKLIGDVQALGKLLGRKQEGSSSSGQKDGPAGSNRNRPSRNQRTSNASKAARQRYARRYGGDAARRRFATRVPGRAGFKGTTALGRAGRFLKSGPGAGLLSGVVSVGTRLASGDSVQKAVGGGIGATVGTVALTALLTPVLGPFAPLVGGTLGGFLGDQVGAFLGDAITPILEPLGNLFKEIILPLWIANIKPVAEPFQELFQEVTNIFNKVAAFLKPIVDPAVKKMIDFLNSNIIGPAIQKLRDFIGGAGQFIQDAAQQTGNFFTKIDFLNLYSGKADKARVASEEAAQRVKKAEENLAHYMKRMQEEGGDKRDHWGDNTLAEDVENARRQLNEAKYESKVRQSEYEKLRAEAEKKAQEEADRRNLGDIQTPRFQGDPGSGNHIVTSAMGNRTLALSPGMHMGVDISTAIGENLVAFTNGKVEGVGYDSGYGNWVSWIANDGYGNFYGHMDKPAYVRPGQQVRKGAVLGVTGNTGRSSGPHLHWEVARNPADTGRSKSNVLSRVNPLGRYHKEHPFGGGPSLSPPQLGHGGQGGSRASTATAISGLNSARTQELNVRSVNEAREALIGRRTTKPIVILQPIVKPVVQQVAVQPQFAPAHSPTNIA